MIVTKEDFDMATDILLSIEHVTVEDACNYLIELGYCDRFYDKNGSYTIDQYADAARVAGVSQYLAEDMKEITFQGGPGRKDWYELDLQCLLEDWTLQCLSIWGTDIVAKSLGVYS